MAIIRAFDNYIFKLRHSATAFKEAVRHKDAVGALHASIEHTKGYATGAQYSVDITEKASMIATVASKYVPFNPVEKSSLHFLQGISSAQVVAGVGTAISVLTIIASGIAIYRQSQVLSCINDHRINLEKVNPNHFKNALPDHLNDEIEKLGGLTEIQASKDVAQDIVDRIKDYASRKRIYHMVVTAGAVISLVASIGAFVAFPPAVLIGLAVVGLSFVIASAVINKAWVENRNKGFDLKLLIPEFLRSKPKDVDIEIPNLSAR